MHTSFVRLQLIAILLCGATLSLADDESGTDSESVRLTRAITNADLPLEEPVVLWKHLAEPILQDDGSLSAVGVGEPAVFEDALYFGDDRGRLQALSTVDGGVLWTHAHGSRIYWAPTVDEDQVYFESERGVTAVKRDDGDLLWQHAFKSGGAPPVVAGKRVFASGNDGCAYALDRATGKQLWKHDFLADAPPDQPGFEGKRARVGDSPARPCGAACDGELLVQCVFDQSRVIAIDCETGERRWTFQTGGWMWPKPTIAGERVYFASQDAHFYCLERTTGKLLWKFKTPGWFQAEAAIADGIAYVPHHHGRLFRLDAETGELIGTFEPGDAEKSLGGNAVLLNASTAYFASMKGQVFAVDTQANAYRWKFRPSEHTELLSPVTDGRRIFLSMRPNAERQGESGIVAIGAAK